MEMIVKALIPHIIAAALANMDKIREVLMAEAAKSTNLLDDTLVGITMDWLEGFLKELAE